MSGEYFKLGQLDCLQEIRIPNSLGEIDVRMTYPEYRDSLFLGFGLQTPDMPFDVHESLFHEKGALREVCRQILTRAGVWQVECSDYRSHQAPNGHFTRSALNWHVDFPEQILFRILTADARCQDTTGETNVTTRTIFLDCCRTLSRLSEVRRDEIGSILAYESTYLPETLSFMRTDLKIADNTDHTGQPMNDALLRPESVIRHFFNSLDADRPNDISPYSTLAWYDPVMMHGTSSPRGQLVARALRS